MKRFKLEDENPWMLALLFFAIVFTLCAMFYSCTGISQMNKGYQTCTKGMCGYGAKIKPIKGSQR